MYRYLSIAAVVLSAAFSARRWPKVSIVFSGESRGGKVHADAPGTFYCGCKINWQGKKALLICNRAAIRCAKMKTAPAA